MRSANVLHVLGLALGVAAWSGLPLFASMLLAAGLLSRAGELGVE